MDLVARGVAQGQGETPGFCALWAREVWRLEGVVALSRYPIALVAPELPLGSSNQLFDGNEGKWGEKCFFFFYYLIILLSPHSYLVNN